MTGRRHQFTEDLDELRIQVDLMAIRVDENLRRMRDLLASGPQQLEDEMCAADDEIDAMNVSLTERSYDLLRREAPVASDLRLVVSVLRVLSELERIGDLALRVARLSPGFREFESDSPTGEVLRTMADTAHDRYRAAIHAWSTGDFDEATQLLASQRALDPYHDRLASEILTYHGDLAAQRAIIAYTVGRAIDRIADHAAIIAARVRYLVSGDPAHLEAEVR